MPASRVSLRVLLDELQAAEEAGAEALGLWLASCDDPRLRGGLRVIRARDLAHARLARRRLGELGGTSGQATPRQLQSLCSVLSAPDVSNRSKLTILLSRFPSRADDPLPDSVRELDDDETRALLETIHADDRASLRWLREAGDVPAVPLTPSATPSMLRFLDAYRAAEAASAEVIACWRAVCGFVGLRGGLDTIAERESVHAEILDERIRELGGVPRARVADAVLAEAQARFASRDVSDEEKLAHVIARYPTDETATAALDDAIDDLEGDPETREILRLIAAGEAATFAWLRSYRRAVAEHPREVSLRVFDGGR
jgi:DNA-binding ferritin-like protein